MSIDNSSSKKNNMIWDDYFGGINFEYTNGKLYDAFQSFHISSKEIIFDYFFKVKSKPEVVITNRAIYFSDIRWSLENLAKFVVVRENDICSILRENDVCYTVSSRLLKSIRDGVDPYARIVSMQEYLLANSENAQKDRLRLLKLTIKNHVIPLSKQSEQILKGLFTDRECKAYSGEILLKHYFTIGDYYNAITISNELLSYLDKEKTISWINNFLLNSSLEEAKSNLSLDEWLSFDSNFRDLDPELNLIVQKIKEEGILSHIHRAISNHQIKSLPELHSSCDPIKSAEIKEKIYIEWWDSVKDDFVNFTENVGNDRNKTSGILNMSTDSICLSPIHYAIFLKNRKMLDSIEITSESIPIYAYNDPQLSILYNPLFVARYLNDDELFNYLYTKTEEYKSLEKSIKILDKKIAQTIVVLGLAKQHKSYKIHEKERQIANYKRYIKSLTTRVKNNHNQQNVNQLREAKIRLQNMESELLHLKNSANNIIADSVIAASAVKLLENFREEKKRTEEEIQELKGYFYKYYSDQISIFNDDSSQFIHYVLSIYANPSEYIKNLNFIDPVIIYFCGKPFIVSKEAYCSFESAFKNEYKKRRSSRTEHKQNHKNKPNLDDVVKPYGNSWFSPQAHNDIQILRREYRKLALKYHPDSEMGSSEIFIDIQNEKAMILNGFE